MKPPIHNNGGQSPVEAAVPAAKPTRRQRMFIRRALRLEAKAKTLFGKMRESIALAMQNGLEIGTPVEIELLGPDGKPAKKFVRLKNNFAGDVAFKRSYVSHYELEDVPKYQWPGAAPKKPKPVEAGVSPANK